MARSKEGKAAEAGSWLTSFLSTAKREMSGGRRRQKKK